MKLPVLLTLAAMSFTQVPDLSSPKSAAKSLYEAAERADEDAIRQILFAQSEPERELAEVYAKLIVSGKHFADAAKKRFGGAADAIAQGAFPVGEIDKLESATVKETGETATLQLPGERKPMTFRRTPAGWQLALADLSAAPDKLPAQIALTRDIAQVFAKLSDEIAAGKYATVQDAETAIQQQINEAMTKAARKRPPTTTPATYPSPREGAGG